MRLVSQLVSRIFYLCSIVGDGTPSVPPPGNPYRAKIADYGVPYMAAAIPSNPATGAPVFPWTIIVIPSEAETVAIQNDNQLRRIPPGRLDRTLTSPQRNALLNFIAEHGISMTIAASDTVREIILRFCRTLGDVPAEWAEE